jgi:hypothetical protein
MSEQQHCNNYMQQLGVKPGTARYLLRMNEATMKAASTFMHVCVLSAWQFLYFSADHGTSSICYIMLLFLCSLNHCVLHTPDAAS